MRFWHPANRRTPFVSHFSLVQQKRQAQEPVLSPLNQCQMDSNPNFPTLPSAWFVPSACSGPSRSGLAQEAFASHPLTFLNLSGHFPRHASIFPPCQKTQCGTTPCLPHRSMGPKCWGDYISVRPVGKETTSTPPLVYRIATRLRPAPNTSQPICFHDPPHNSLLKRFWGAPNPRCNPTPSPLSPWPIHEPFTCPFTLSPNPLLKGYPSTPPTPP